MIIRKSFPQIYELHRGGQAYWIGSARSTKWNKNERKTFATKKAALDWAKGIEEELARYGAQADVPKEKVVMADAYANLVDRLRPY
jgi:hypothetical protein